ncbi:MAG: cell division protein ZapE [Alteromonadaceae bacterium]|nr:cell division protein ZapE [Alteromonadaceae bacterium]
MQLAYQKLIQSKKISPDPAQLAAVEALSLLSDQLVENQKRSRWFSVRKNNCIKGLYFHGRVGRGKTMLMDLFFQQLAIKNKKRIHFHRFMENVHQQLNQLSGQEDPLTHIARIWAADLDVLCFDEFFVTDIGDAILIAGLLKELFRQGVVLIATSNCQPENLYKNGLQRERFLPTIELINRYCQIISIDGDKDHRLTFYHFQKNNTKKKSAQKNSDQKLNAQTKYRDYFFPHHIHKDQLPQIYQKLTKQSAKTGSININNRLIPFTGQSQCFSQNVIWFEFSALCSGPRSQRDYIALADKFQTVFISDVPCFSGKLIPAVFSGVEDSYQRSGILMADLRHLDDEARRFIALVDEFYDRKGRLIITAAVDIDELYQGQQLSFEFARCQSRLFEMQSIQY